MDDSNIIMDYSSDQLAYCGIYCTQCSFKTANETGSRAHLERAPDKYDSYRQKDLAALACPGCKGEAICGECEMKDCAAEKGFASCADCENFPCSILLAFANDGIPHHGWAFENLKAIREFGAEKWFEGFKGNLVCDCGERLSWYYGCPKHTGK